MNVSHEIPADIPQDPELRCPAETWTRLPCFRRIGHDGPHFTSVGSKQRWFDKDERHLQEDRR